MSLLASDNFNRANVNPIGSPWTTISAETAMRIVSNAATPSSLVVDGGCYHSTVVWPADQYSKAKLSCTGTAGGSAGVCLHVRVASAAQTYYRLEVDHAATNNVTVHRVNAGVFTVLPGFPLTQAWSDGDTWEIRALGPTISVYRNGALVLAVTDSSPIASGSPGFGYSSSETAVSVDDWEGGDFAGASAVRIPLNWALKTKPAFNTAIPAVVSSSAFRRTLHPFGAGKGKRTKGR